MIFVILKKRFMLILLILLLPQHASSEPSPVKRSVQYDKHHVWSDGVPEKERRVARKLYASGNKEFAESRFAQALAQYQEALRHWDHPAFHFNLAICLINLGRPVEALDNIERSLVYGPAALGADHYQQAITYRNLLEGQLARVTIECSEPGAKVTIDGRFLFAGPGAKEEVVLPGEHQVVAVKSGFLTSSETFIIVAGRTMRRDIQLASAPQHSAQLPCVTDVRQTEASSYAPISSPPYWSQLLRSSDIVNEHLQSSLNSIPIKIATSNVENYINSSILNSSIMSAMSTNSNQSSTYLTNGTQLLNNNYALSNTSSLLNNDLNQASSSIAYQVFPSRYEYLFSQLSPYSQTGYSWAQGSLGNPQSMLNYPNLKTHYSMLFLSSNIDPMISDYSSQWPLYYNLTPLHYKPSIPTSTPTLVPNSPGSPSPIVPVGVGPASISPNSSSVAPVSSAPMASDARTLRSVPDRSFRPTREVSVPLVAPITRGPIRRAPTAPVHQAPATPALPPRSDPGSARTHRTFSSPTPRAPSRSVR